MASPVADTYSAASGVPVYGGRYPLGGRLSGEALLSGLLAEGGMAALASDLAGEAVLAGVTAGGGMAAFDPPAWRSGATPLQWTAISGTVGPTFGLNTDAFGSLVLAPAAKLVSVADGGHGDGNSNAAAALDLSLDSPSWVLLRASTWNGTEADVERYADGSPPSRHTYYGSHYDAALNAIVLVGMRFGWGGATPVAPDVDVFSLDTNEYLPRYTWPALTPWPASNYGNSQDLNGNIWTRAGYKLDRGTLTWSKPGTGFPLNFNALNTATGKIFSLQCGSGEDGGAGITSNLFDPDTGNSVAISFNSSPALTAFEAARPAYGWMTYCTADGKFYYAAPGDLNNLYVITPNGGTTWDMARQALGGVTLTNTTPLSKRFHWVPALQCFVVQTLRTNNLHFFTLG